MAAEDQTAQGNDGVGSTNNPVHAGSLEQLAQDGFTARIHHPELANIARSRKLPERMQ